MYEYHFNHELNTKDSINDPLKTHRTPNRDPFRRMRPESSRSNKKIRRSVIYSKDNDRKGKEKGATQSSIYLFTDVNINLPIADPGHEYGGCWPCPGHVYPSFEYCPPLLSHDSLPDCDE